jgi:ribose 5-phosphate isomerase B
MLYIGADHNGFDLKEDLKKFLESSGYAFFDVGAEKLEPADDYPDFAEKVAKEVSKDPEKNKGILICRSGHGVCIVADKFQNVRSALCWNEKVAWYSRNDDNTNVLCLPSGYVSPEVSEEITKVWLETPFSGDERHIRRIAKIKKLDE